MGRRSPSSGPSKEATSASARGSRRKVRVPKSATIHETLVRETHHRVKGSLQIVASLLTMQANSVDDAIVKRALHDATARISTIALIHAQLSETSPRVTHVDMRAFILELAQKTQRTFADAATHVSVSLTLDRVLLPIRVATACGLLVGELLTNAYNHAFKGVEKGALEVRITADAHVVTLVVRDDGPGMPQEDDQETGLGLQLIRLLATKQLRGDLSITSSNGTTFTVTFPIEPPQSQERPKSSDPVKGGLRG